MNRWLSAVVLAAIVAGGAAAALGDADGDVDLSAALEVWGSVLRDVDQFGLRLTRVSASEEMNIGDRTAAWVGTAAPDSEWTRYVVAIGETMVPHVQRKDIRYTFSVVDWAAVNAFAMPGGRIFVTTGMLEFVESEAELAAVLGHEISHVDLRHCIERFQYRLKLEKLRLDALPVVVLHDIGRWLIETGYTKYQELDADAQGLRLAIRAGYDPGAGPAVFARLAARYGEARRPRARTPVGEVGRAVSSALGAYVESHPESQDRMRRLEQYVSRNRRHLTGRQYYVGRENLRLRVPRTEQVFSSERTVVP